MARHIYPTEAELLEIQEKLRKQRGLDGEIKFSLSSDDRKVKVLFAPIAWAKMFKLVDDFTTEVQWHGLVSRLDETSFLIEDILVPPHEASAATVVSDQEEYEKWLEDLPIEVFLKNRFHGHSHVNMGVTPSGVDMGYRKNMINNFSTSPQEDEDQFYIFLICNKRREISGQVFDLTNNALYETNDIRLDVDLGGGTKLSDFIAEAKRVVTAPTTTSYTTQKGGTGWNYNGGYNGYGGYYGGAKYEDPPKSLPNPKTDAKPVTKNTAVKENKPENKQTSIETSRVYPDIPYEKDEEWLDRVFKGASNR